MIQTFTADFLDDFVRKFGLENESDEVRARLFVKLNERIAARVQERMYATLAQEERRGVDTLLMNGDMGGVERFISAHGMDFNSLVHDEAKKEVDIASSLMKVTA